MKRSILFLCLVLAVAGQSFAQQDPRFTHYIYNQMYFNPAYAGLDGVARFMLLGRSQWTSYNQDGGTAPNTGLFSFNTPLLRINSGIGANVSYEKFAATTSLRANVNYAYHLNVAGGKLSFGVQAGIASDGKDGSRYRALQDESILHTNNTSTQFDVGAGVYFKKEKFFLGVSSTHLTEPVQTFSGYKQTLYRHYYGIAGYNFTVSPTLTITPSVLFKTAAFKSKASQLEGNVIANFSNRFWAGLGYTQQEAANLLVGVSLLKDNSLRLGYSLDLITNGKDAKQSTSNEIMLSYSIPVALKGPKPAIRTPRYRK